ncbi:hypothetical protein IFM89_009222, partial [Coptis chinensis]
LPFDLLEKVFLCFFFVKVVVYIGNVLALHMSKPESTSVKIQEWAVPPMVLGAPIQDHLKYNVVLVIGMGIGATPNEHHCEGHMNNMQVNGERGLKEGFLGANTTTTISGFLLCIYMV